MTEYIERDYVLKLLGVFNDRVHGDYHFMNGIETAKEIVEDAPSTDVQPVKWIPVTEQLPEENGRYLTVMHRTVDQQYRNELGDDDTEVRITRFCKGEWKVPLHSPKWINEAITDTVTHWMSLPKLPKDNET